MTSVSKNVCVDKLADILNEYNNTYTTIKTKHFYRKCSSYVDFGVENNDIGLKFKVVDHVGISHYKNIFAKVYAPNWSQECFVIKKAKNVMSLTYIIEDFVNGQEIVGTFYEKELQKKKSVLRIVEVIIKIIPVIKLMANKVN